MQCALPTLIDNSFYEKYDLHADSLLSITQRKFVSVEERCLQPRMLAVSLDIEYVHGNHAILIPNA